MVKKEKYPMVDNPLEVFIISIINQARLCGIDQIPELDHYVDLLIQEVRKYDIREQKVPSSKKNLKYRRRKSWIAIFNRKYLDFMDYEPSKRITGTEIKLIDATVEFLYEHGFESEEFLTWYFDEYLQKDINHLPPRIMGCCTNFCRERFLCEKDYLRKERKEKQLKRTLIDDLCKRCRVILRETSSLEIKEEVLEALKNLKNECIMINEFKELVEKLEKRFLEEIKAGDKD